jgi:hypothetical protein
MPIARPRANYDYRYLNLRAAIFGYGGLEQTQFLRVVSLFQFSNFFTPRHNFRHAQACRFEGEAADRSANLADGYQLIAQSGRI